MIYYVFVLGYDLLQKQLDGIECDVAFEICEEIYKNFCKNKLFNDTSMSKCEALQLYLNTNSKLIELIFEKRGGYKW